MSTLEAMQTVWPVLAGLTYLLVTSVLAVLASAHNHAVQQHDLIRHARERRIEYLRAQASPPANHQDEEEVI